MGDVRRRIAQVLACASVGGCSMVSGADDLVVDAPPSATTHAARVAPPPPAAHQPAGTTSGAPAPPPAAGGGAGATTTPSAMISCGASTCAGASPSCCISPAANAASCVATSATCEPNAFRLDCDDASDCAAGEVCCADIEGGSATCTSAGRCGPGAKMRVCRTDADCDSYGFCDVPLSWQGRPVQVSFHLCD